MKMRIGIFLILALMIDGEAHVLFSQVPSPSAEKSSTISVMELNATGISKDEAENLRGYLEDGLVNCVNIKVIDKSSREEIFREQGYSLTGACDQTTCLVEIGEMLSADKMAGGRIGKVGSTWTIQIRLVDVSTSRIEKSVIKEFQGELDQAIGLVKEIARELCLAISRAGAPPQPPPRISIHAIPDTIESGQSAVLQWVTQNADSVYLEGLGKFSPSGRVSVSPLQSCDYKIVAIGSGGRDSATVHITVRMPVPTGLPPKIKVFSVNPTEIRPGESAKLEWSITDATSAILYYQEPGAIEVCEGIGFCGPKTVSPKSSTTYTIKAQGKGGMVRDSVRLVVSTPVYTTKAEYRRTRITSFIGHSSTFSDFDRGRIGFGGKFGYRLSKTFTIGFLGAYLPYYKSIYHYYSGYWEKNWEVKETYIPILVYGQVEKGLYLSSGAGLYLYSFKAKELPDSSPYYGSSYYSHTEGWFGIPIGAGCMIGISEVGLDIGGIYNLVFNGQDARTIHAGLYVGF
ncbi:MAG: hypothetical protein AB1393_03105 [Candidatus Edwardsbacteria bacterium]